MKVFVPVCDGHLSDGSFDRSSLVPFSPEFVTESVLRSGKQVSTKNGTKPRNWVAESDYTAACQRLAEENLALA